MPSPKNELRVVVYGSTGSGKETMSKLIFDSLFQAGFTCSFRDEEKTDPKDWFAKVQALKAKNPTVIIENKTVAFN